MARPKGSKNKFTIRIPQRMVEREYSKLERTGALQMTQAQFETVVTQPCSFCGGAKHEVVGVDATWRMTINDVERVDPKLPYTADNVYPCCGLCRLMKRGFTPIDFLAHAEKIAAETRRIHDKVRSYRSHERHEEEIYAASHRG